MICNQSLSIGSEELRSFCVTHPKKRIVCGGKSMVFFDYDEPRDQWLADEKACLRVIYNETLFVFITLHPDSVKIWDARNGVLVATHRQLTKGEFASCYLDDRERKLFLGDTIGKIFAINVRNGATLKTFGEHKKGGASTNKSKDPNKLEQQESYGAISDLGYCPLSEKVKVLVTSSECSTLKIHDDSESDPSKSRSNEMSHHKKAINAISIKKSDVPESEESGGFTLPAVVASASEDGSIIITNLSSYRIEAQIRHPQGKPFKKLLFLNPHDVLVAVDSDGSRFLTQVEFTSSVTSKIGNSNFIFLKNTELLLKRVWKKMR